MLTAGEPTSSGAHDTTDDYDVVATRCATRKNSIAAITSKTIVPNSDNG